MVEWSSRSETTLGWMPAVVVPSRVTLAVLGVENDARPKRRCHADRRHDTAGGACRGSEAVGGRKDKRDMNEYLMRRSSNCEPLVILQAADFTDAELYASRNLRDVGRVVAARHNFAGVPARYRQSCRYCWMTPRMSLVKSMTPSGSVMFQTFGPAVGPRSNAMS